ncbi:MAG: hypothetical protein R3E79_37710 [Caldilineaceae bacterium]
MQGKADFGGAAGLIDIAGGGRARFRRRSGQPPSPGRPASPSHVAAQAGAGPAIVKPQIGFFAIIEDEQPPRFADDGKGRAPATIRRNGQDGAVAQANLAVPWRVPSAAGNQAAQLDTSVTSPLAQSGSGSPTSINAVSAPVTAVVDQVWYAIGRIEVTAPALFHHFTQVKIGRHPPPIQRKEQRHLMRAARSDNPIHFRQAGRRRLITEDPAYAGRNCLLDLLGVQGLAGGDTEDVRLGPRVTGGRSHRRSADHWQATSRREFGR